MPLIDLHWYSRNEGIDYPVDDSAGCLTDSGLRLPTNIISDLNLRWPDTLGAYAFLASVTVTPLVVAVTIQAASTLDSDPALAPLAVLTVPQPVEQGRQYALQAQAAGVGGWIVFGDGVADAPFQGRFSSPARSVLTQRAARAYSVLPVVSLGLLNATTALTGIVRLRATAPLQIAAQEQEIDGVLQNCIVISLVGPTAQYPVPAQLATVTGYQLPSVLEQFAGPCSGRPESGTCGDPQPVEFINAVGPDCDGNITIQFQGCASLVQLDPCGIAVECGLGLMNACLPANIPNSDGILPNEYTPLEPATPTPTPTPSSESLFSESSPDIGALPYLTCFGGDVDTDFLTQYGLWELTNDATDVDRTCPDFTDDNSDSSQAYVMTSNTAASVSVITWNAFDYGTIDREVITDVKLLQGPVGAKHNASLVLNYQPNPSVPIQNVYFQATIDYDIQSVQLGYFNGANFQVLATVNAGIILNAWYRIDAKITTVEDDEPSIVLHFTSLEDDTVDVTIGPTSISNYTPTWGYFGFQTNRAISSFSFLSVAQYNG